MVARDRIELSTLGGPWHTYAGYSLRERVKPKIAAVAGPFRTHSHTEMAADDPIGEIRAAMGDRPWPENHDPASLPRFVREVPAGTILRRQVVDHLKASGWPPQEPRLIFLLIENLLAGQDYDGWSTPVELAFSLAMAGRRARRRRLYQNWNALEQLNAWERIWRAWRLTSKATEPTDINTEAVATAARATAEVARIAEQQQMLRHAEKGGRLSNVLSILDGWNPTRAAGRFEGGQASWLLLCCELWRDLRGQVIGADRVDVEVCFEDFAEFYVACVDTLKKPLTEKQKELVRTYRHLSNDRGHVTGYSAPAAMAEAFRETYRAATVKRLSKFISKAKIKAKLISP